MRDEAVDRCAAADSEGRPEDHCITCGDEGIPMQVLSTDAALTMCLDAADDVHPVATDLVDPVQIGDQVLVHAGVAIRHLARGEFPGQSRSAAR